MSYRVQFVPYDFSKCRMVKKEIFFFFKLVFDTKIPNYLFFFYCHKNSISLCKSFNCANSSRVHHFVMIVQISAGNSNLFMGQRQEYNINVKYSSQCIWPNVTNMCTECVINSFWLYKCITAKAIVWNPRNINSSN